MWALWLCLVGALAQERPTLSGEVTTIDSEDGLFRVHFTREGRDAVAGGTDVPPVVAAVLDGLALGVSELGARGYRELVEDDGAGGTAAIDVYLRVLDINGYAYAWPASDEVTEGVSCYLEVDSGLDAGNIGASVTIHELMHCVQYRYSSEVANWLGEASATMEQYLAVTDATLSLAVGVLWATRLGAPEVALDDRAGRMEYASFIFMKFWEDFDAAFHDPVVDPPLPALWEALAEEPDWWVTLDAVATARWGLDLGQAFLEYATWNAHACGRDVGAHYGESLPCTAPGAAVPIETFVEDGEKLVVALDDAPLTAQYQRLEAGEGRPVALSCRWPRVGAQLDLRLLARDSLGNTLEAVSGRAVEGEDLELSLTQALEPGGDVLVVAASTGREPLSTKCTVTRVDAVEPEVEVPAAEPPEGAACGCRQGAAAPWWLAWWLGLVWWQRRQRAR